MDIFRSRHQDAEQYADADPASERATGTPADRAAKPDSARSEAVDNRTLDPGNQSVDIETQSADETTFPEPLVIGAQPKLLSDPKGLPDSQFKVPDTVLDGADLEGLAIRAASLRGDDHRFFATTRQDSMDISRISDGHTEAILVCVADGVGSEPLSHHGSAQACRLLREEVQGRAKALFAAEATRGLPELCQDIAECLAQRLTEIADYLKISPQALSTTLVGALIEAHPIDAALRRYVLLGVGDSTALLLRGGGFQHCFPDQHDGMITGTGTNALPTSPGRIAAARGVLSRGEMLMICTDGMSNPMRNPQVAAQLAAWWSGGQIPGLPEFGWQVSFRAKSYGDDRTAVCVWAR